ncbi:TPA: WecB/TagA/CpsF family glycosyltransferase [Vibrio vulnificus]|nr:WecB/TagA/CpsF family glycosyltransferase [Vibrio vulnificus]
MKLNKFDVSMLEFSENKLFTFVNPYSYYLFKDELTQDEKNCFNIFVDGISLVKLYNFFSSDEDKIERYSFDFTSLAPTVFEFCERNNIKVAIVGSTDDELELAISVILKRFENLNIVFVHNGFFNIDDEFIYESLSKSGAELVISGMGTPRQEKFLLKVKKNCSCIRLGFTCGGFLTQISTNPDYFSPIMSRFHLRWLQRFIRHSFVRKRVLVDYPKFFIRFLFETYKQKIK